MKKFTVLFCSLYFLSLNLQAQTPFITRDSLNINNINASVLLHGDMWWDPTAGVARAEFPKGSGDNIAFTTAVWMSGYDAGGSLHVASQTYRQNGNDYWPGPLYPTDTLTYATCNDWARFWKIFRTDIDSFLTLGTHTVANTPASILEWPGKGNTYATGTGGAALTVSTDMAPFIDLNGNGIYEPLAGEYPAFNGDEAIWWVFSDNGPTHTNSNGLPLGAEVHVLNYAYHRNTLIDNVVYYDYTIVNRSARDYHDFRLSLWADMDLGNYLNDFIGFDSVHRMGIIYNGTEVDYMGSPSPGMYTDHIPVAGVTLVRMPGDTAGSYVPAGAFTYYNNDFSIIGNPAVDTEYNNYMRARLRDGSHFTNDFAGRGIPTKGYGSGPNTNYVFTGDPQDTTKWSECNCYNNPGDRRFIISSGDMTLPAGGELKISMALITTWPDTANACPHVSFDSIGIYADTAWGMYHSVPPAGVHQPSTAAMSLYPNPATDFVVIAGAAPGSFGNAVTVCNTLGQCFPLVVTNSSAGIRLQTTALPPGCYHILTGLNHDLQPLTFVKL
jgi:hypothetical protein